ncbi:PfkB family carbohydrate kinase [Virgibacillus byunsanensis]|uniref:PfkB family carbohydrate kinase n=1 Tax=Virgibacillus byunsanensis TaxID=570945 RepID=A0ABW3LTA0_9BACI
MLKKSEFLNEKEQKLFHLIKKDPYISQQELANALNLSRPSIANLISGLVKKGYIRGKAYIVNETEPVVCIGGANVDRKFYGQDTIQLGTSNPVRSTQSAGGVARNISENLGRFGQEVSLITASGADTDWSFIESSSSLYMDLDQVVKVPHASTGSYTAVLDDAGDLVVALADMEVYESITPELIATHTNLLSYAKCIVADLNCPKETLQALCQFAKTHHKPIVLVSVSAPKMKRLPEDLHGVTWLITNRDETEEYFHDEITTNEAWKQAVNKWLTAGVSNVVITNGKDGAMIGNKDEGIYHVPSMETTNIADVTGAGDAFSSAVIYAWLENKSLIDIATAGIVNASKTLQSTFTVRQDLSPTQLQKDMEELK